MADCPVSSFQIEAFVIGSSVGIAEAICDFGRPTFFLRSTRSRHLHLHNSCDQPNTMTENSSITMLAVSDCARNEHGDRERNECMMLTFIYH